MTIAAATDADRRAPAGAGHRRPRDAVCDQGEPAAGHDGDHEGDPEDHRIDVEAIGEAGQDPGDDAVIGVAAKPTWGCRSGEHSANRDGSWRPSGRGR